MAIGVRIGPILKGAAGGLRVGTGNSAAAPGTTTMSLAITDSVDPAPAGNNFTYAVVATNTGSIDATSVSCAITLAASLTFVSAAGAGWTCNAVGQVVTCTRATMAAGAAPTITVTVTAGNTAASITTTGALSASDASTANASEGTTITRPTGTLTITDSADPTPAGNNFTYAAVAHNSGLSGVGTMNNVSVAVTLDASLTYVSASGTGWTCNQSAGVVTCTRASMAVGDAATITITATAGNAAITASTSGVLSGGNISNISSGTQTTVVSKLTQTVVVTDSAGPVISGADAFSYTVQVHNSGLSGVGTANNLSCAVTLDSSLAYVSSSGTGWSFGVSGQVVTATIASLAVGDANAITINVTTGTGAVSASTSASLTADNATTASGSQGTTVQLVSKDATAGIYCPASSTEWTNFLARKGLTASVPDALWLLQEASGNAADSIGSFTLTAASSPAYQNAETGWSRKGVGTVSGATARFSSTSASLPDISTSSMLTLIYADVATAAASVQAFLDQGTTTKSRLQINNTGQKLRCTSGVLTAESSASPNGAVHPYVLRTDRTAGSTTGFDHAEKLVPTWTTTVTGKSIVIGSQSGNTVTMNVLYGCQWHTAHAELSDANIKALLQALGWTITWT